MNARREYADTPPEGPPTLPAERSWHATAQLSRDNEDVVMEDSGADETCCSFQAYTWKPPVERIRTLEEPASVAALYQEEQITARFQFSSSTTISLPMRITDHVGVQRSNDLDDIEARNHLVPISNSQPLPPPEKDNTWTCSEPLQCREGVHNSNHDSFIRSDRGNWTLDENESFFEDFGDAGTCSMQVDDEVSDNSFDVMDQSLVLETREPRYDACFGMVSRVTYLILKQCC